MIPESSSNSNRGLLSASRVNPSSQNNILGLQSARSGSNLNDTLSTIGPNAAASAHRQNYTSGGGHLLSPSSSAHDYTLINELRRELRKKEQEFGKERSGLKQQV